MDKGTNNEITLEDGKLFEKMRSYAFMGDATLEELTPFLYFLDKCVSKLVGRRELNDYFKSNRNMTLLDKSQKVILPMPCCCVKMEWMCEMNQRKSKTNVISQRQRKIIREQQHNHTM